MAVIVFLFVLAIGGGVYILSSKPQVPGTSFLPIPEPSATIESEVKSEATESGKIIIMENGLKIEDLVSGAGVEAVSGKNVTVNYLGTLPDGTKFDSSYDRNQPFTFLLGAGEVIKGWDEGVNGMKVGGKRRLTIPPSLGYGAADLGVIPPNSTLIFEVELLDVK